MSSRKLVQVVARQLSTSARRSADEIHPGYAKFRAKQEYFQRPDGKPVHLQGPLDGLFYRLTMGLCVVALGGDFYAYYVLAFPNN